MFYELIKEQYSFQDFWNIIHALRSEQGCPWDREQTHESLKPCMMEEAAELVASIRIFDKTGNSENLKEELGDILLQVMLHSEIANEEGLFDVNDVIQEVSEKMVRRHPHVFGTIHAENSTEALRNWEDIKKQEKIGKDWVETPLRDVPKELPSLTRAQKVLKKADKLYSQGNTTLQNLDNIQKAVDSLRELSENDSFVIKEKIGQILLSVADLSRIYKVHPEQILTDQIEEIIEKYE